LSCDIGYTSYSGAEVCTLADEGYFLSYPSEESVDCPENARCVGGVGMPVPVTGYWVDRSSYRYSGVIYECARATCKGGRANSSCWDINHYNDSSCDDDATQCTEGAGGAYCGACLEGYVYRGATNSCGPCATVQLESYLLFGSLFFVGLVVAVYFLMGDYFNIQQHPVVQYVLNIDTGSLKVGLTLCFLIDYF
jgi:hypothetical protein